MNKFLDDILTRVAFVLYELAKVNIIVARVVLIVISPFLIPIRMLEFVTRKR